MNELNGYFLHDPGIIEFAYQLVREYDEHQKEQDKLARKNRKASLKFTKGRWFSDDRIKHGRRSAPEYRVWDNLVQRAKSGKIVLHGPWTEDFMTFYKHVKKRPGDKYRFKLVDKNKPYEPGNVEWVAPKGKLNGDT